MYTRVQLCILKTPPKVKGKILSRKPSKEMLVGVYQREGEIEKAIHTQLQASKFQPECHGRREDKDMVHGEDLTQEALTFS